LNIFSKVKIFFSNLFSQVMISIFFRRERIGSDKLLVINTEKLGDQIIASDFLYSLRKNNLYKQYDLLISEYYRSLFDWNELKFNAITINKNKYRYNLLYRLKIINQIRHERYSHVINITQERGMINEELALISGAEKKTAMKRSSLYLPNFILNRNNKLYSEILDSPYKNEYERLSYYLLKNKIKLEGNDNLFGNGNISLQSIHSNLKAYNYIIIAPMSSELDRSWGIDNFKQLCSLIKEDIVLIGTEDERDLLDSICSDRENILNLGGKLSFEQIAFLMKNCSLYIGNDSGLTHMAHQLRVPLLAIIGGGKYGKFFPYKEREDAVFLFDQMDCFGCDWKCIHDKKYCLINVIPELVYSKFNIHKKKTNEN